MSAIRWPDARGFVGIACYLLVLIVLGMLATDHTLLHDDFFKTIATAIVLTGWNNGPVGWAYQGTKTGGDLAAGNQAIVTAQAAASPPLSDTPVGNALVPPPRPPDASPPARPQR